MKRITMAGIEMVRSKEVIIIIKTMVMMKITIKMKPILISNKKTQGFSLESKYLSLVLRKRKEVNRQQVRKNIGQSLTLLSYATNLLNSNQMQLQLQLQLLIM